MKISSSILLIATSSVGVGAWTGSNKGSISRRSFFDATSTAAVGALLLPVAPANAADFAVGGKIKYGDESIMSPKDHGTSAIPVQSDLMYGVSNKLADRICN